MKFQRIWAGLMAAIGVGTAACWAAPAGTAAWSSDKALSGKLAPAAIVGKYQIQPPQGYALQTKRGPVGSDAYAWVGTTRVDGTRPYLMLGLFTPPAGEANKYTLKEACAKMLAGVERRRKDWKQSPMEQGSVNGMTFERVYWQGVDTATEQPMSGFLYVAKDGNAILQIASQDVAAHTKNALPLAEAAALTFRKK